MTAYIAEKDLKVATTAISTAIANDDPEYAAVLLKSYRTVLGTSYDNMAKLVRDAEISKNSFDIAERVDEELPEGTLSAKNARTRELTGDDIELTKAADVLTARKHSLDKKFKRESKELTYSFFTPKIAAATDPEQIQAVIKEIELTVEDPVIRADLIAKARKGLRQRSIVEGSKEDWYNKTQLQAAQGTLTVEELNRVNKWNLTKSDSDFFEHLITGGAAERVGDYNMALDARIKTWYPNSTEKGIRKLLKKKITDWQKFYFQKNQVQPSNEEIAAEEKRLRTEVVYDEDIIFNDMIERFRLGEVKIKDVPKNLIPGIVEKLLVGDKNGKPYAITTENIRKAYRHDLEQGR
jgi:hypothetical protein